MGLFTNKRDTESQYEELLEQAKQQAERFTGFVEKIKARMNEFCEEAIPELLELSTNDPDIHKRGYYRLASAVNAQIEDMANKVSAVRDKEVIKYFNQLEKQIDFGTQAYSRLHEIRIELQKVENGFEAIEDSWKQRIKETGELDNEKIYKEALEEFEKTKDNFNCKQCGGQLQIKHFFVLTTYVTCPNCQTQNSFQPSTKASLVPHIARSIAEQRTKNLKIEHEKDPRSKEKYETYLRTMFDEWNKIVPEMAEGNELFYKRMLESFRN